jgi:hypothetical protein
MLRPLLILFAFLAVLTVASLVFDNPELDCDTDTACQCDLDCLE